METTNLCKEINSLIILMICFFKSMIYKSKCMFQKLPLQLKLVGSFLSVVLVVALVGWVGISSLNQNLQMLADNTLPGIVSLWKINEGQTQIQSAERYMLKPSLTDSQRQHQLQRIENAWQQINEGFKEYEPVEKTPKEKELYQIFLASWNQ